MTDFQGWLLSKAAKFLVKLSGIALLPWSLYIVIREKRYGRYKYEVARGWDILANKLYEPALSKKLGPNFGKDETISERMAFNKYNNIAYPDAAKWEKHIDVFDKDHLKKTMEKMNMN